VEGRAPQAPGDVARETGIAKAAGDVAANIGGSAPPLLFERALLAETEGRRVEALSDLDELLEAYPGFLTAAIASARLSLAVKDPGRAIRSLAYVESELIHNREGAALLADALRAVGMHEAASRYDLATLMCLGYVDSRGNDCAPVDMMGNTTSDVRMPPAFLLGTLADGRVLSTDRGLYYVSNSTAGGYLAALMDILRLPLPAPRSSVSRGGLLRRAMSNFLQGPKNRLSLFFAAKGWPFPGGFVARVKARSGSTAADDDRLWQIYRLDKHFAAAGRWMLQIAADPRIREPIYRFYKRLPTPIRYRLNKIILRPVRRRIFSDWHEIPERDRRSGIARERLWLGIARIFQFRTTPRAAGSERIETADSNGAWNVAVLSSQKPSDSGATNPAAARLEQLLKSGALPPPAAEVLSGLLQEASSPRSKRSCG
jgi:hypothetical protein